MSETTRDMTWRELRPLLEAALEMPPSERENHLRELASRDAALARRVRTLLQQAETSDDLDVGIKPLSAVAYELGVVPERAKGSRIGRYVLERLVGFGGMGAVYEARDPALRRRVAIKILQPGSTSEHAMTRFEREASLLARLQHPSIAQVFEAGRVETETRGGPSCPFIAMEFIEGATPITEYAQHENLAFDPIVRLLLSACSAIEHAHQRGVIHRDLKPANVLVDSLGDVKVIDFGIARSLDASMAMTITGRVAGTLRYMSPEQCQGRDEADIRTDIYSLGVILYELLEKKSPYRNDEGGLGTLLDDVRLGKVQEPALAMIDDAGTRRDASAVLRKAMSPEPRERYASVSALAEDLHRLLSNQPVAARSPTTFHEVRLFARRNRSLVLVVSIAILSLLVGATAAGVGMIRARQAQARAEHEHVRALRALNFFHAMLMAANPSIELNGELAPIRQWLYGPSLGGSARRASESTRIADVLRWAGEHARLQLGDDAELRARVEYQVGSDLAGMYEFEPAIALLRDSFESMRRMLGPDHDDTLRSQAVLCHFCAPLVDADSAIALTRDLRDRFLRRFGPDDFRSTYAINLVAIQLHAAHRLDEALQLLDEEIAKIPKVPPVSAALVSLHHLHAAVLLDQAKPESLAGGRQEAEWVLESWIQLESEIGPNASNAATLLSGYYATLDRPRQLQFLRQALRGNEITFGPGSPSAYESRRALVLALLTHGNVPEAEGVARDQLRYARQTFGEDHDITCKSKASLARILTRAGKAVGEAELLAREAYQGSLAYYSDEMGGDWPAYFYGIWAAAIRQRGNVQEAEHRLREALAARARSTAKAEWTDAYLHIQLAEALVDQTRADDAEDELNVARTLLDRLHDETFPMYADIAECQCRLRP